MTETNETNVQEVPALEIAAHSIADDIEKHIDKAVMDRDASDIWDLTDEISALSDIISINARRSGNDK